MKRDLLDFMTMMVPFALGLFCCYCWMAVAAGAP